MEFPGGDSEFIDSQELYPKRTKLRRRKSVDPEKPKIKGKYRRIPNDPVRRRRALRSKRGRYLGREGLLI
jgi:hypothetical protein